MVRVTGKFTGAILAVCVVTALPSIANARTWYVKQDGSGDAPTISAAVDSAVAGDTVLVAPGTYGIKNGILLKEGLIVTSEAGPRDTKIIPQPYQYPPFLFGCYEYYSFVRTEISGFWIEGFHFGFANEGAISIVSCSEVYIIKNIMTRNDVAISVGAEPPPPSLVYIQGNTFTDNASFTILGGWENGRGYIENNIIWGHCDEIGVWWNIVCNCIYDLSDIPPWMTSMNFSLDPQFCGTSENGNLYLQSDSPCAPYQSPVGTICGLTGALPVGCDTAPTKKTTWGALKNIYR